jgi:hypothetical protein
MLCCRSIFKILDFTSKYGTEFCTVDSKMFVKTYNNLMISNEKKILKTIIKLLILIKKTYSALNFGLKNFLLLRENFDL